MRVINRTIAIHSRNTECDESVCDILAVVHKGRKGPCVGHHNLAVTCESVGSVGACACFARVVWSGRRNGNMRAFGDHGFCGLGQVSGLGQNDGSNG